MTNNLPQGWVECELKELIDLQNGYAFSSKDYVSYSNTLNIRMSNIRPNGVFDYNHNIKYLPDDYAKKYSDYLLNDGDLIIAMTDMADNSKILGVPTLVKRSDDQNFLMNQRVGRLLPNSESVYIPFLKYVLVSPKVRNVYKKKGKGGLQLNLSKNDILSIFISIPPLNEQKRIVEKIEEVFEKIDEGIEKLKLVQEQIKQYKQSVLKSAFDGKLYKTTEWEETTLEKVTKKIGDIDHKMPKERMEGIPYISPKDFYGENEIDFKNSKKISKEDFIRLSKKIKPEQNDIIFPRYGTIGILRYIEVDIDFLVSYSCAVIKTSNEISNSKYIYYYLQSPQINSQIQNSIRQTTQANIGIQSIKEFRLYVGTLEEQQKIVEEIEKRFEVADNVAKIVEENLEKAEQLKQSILKKAFEGRLGPQDPSDEPASVLLERIKEERNKK